MIQGVIYDLEKDVVISDLEEDVVSCDPEKVMTVSNHEKKSDFNKSQQLHMIQKLLPVMTKMNEEKMIDLDTEAKSKGICHGGLQVQIAGYTWKKECSTHENVWSEFLKFKLWFSSGFLQDHTPDHYDAVIQSLPIQEYVNPFTGFLNLGAYPPYQTKNPNLSSYVSISYGGLDNPLDADLLMKLSLHTYDMVSSYF
ncbi:hypothetical protein L1987_38420 [Smallanthus sonchifolius]|uniref:Uncharacterized protein n=1 Tax=Smallanthus sonchifolius TaxID=185202 RepID=A0ACB9HLN6_9ASTR|nr:hypothetical protein L1987_38420 [Smallanthus sonchifolius]